MYLIEILHQTTTSFYCGWFSQRCILSKFYIKPQPSARVRELLKVVSYRNSTSNHNNRSSHNIGQLVVSYRNSTSNHNYNRAAVKNGRVVSYRNSTSNHNSTSKRLSQLRLYLIEILHQTTTRHARLFELSSCILSKFYIKPQLSQSMGEC